MNKNLWGVLLLLVVFGLAYQNCGKGFQNIDSSTDLASSGGELIAGDFNSVSSFQNESPYCGGKPGCWMHPYGDPDQAPVVLCPTPEDPVKSAELTWFAYHSDWWQRLAPDFSQYGVTCNDPQTVLSYKVAMPTRLSCSLKSDGTLLRNIDTNYSSPGFAYFLKSDSNPECQGIRPFSLSDPATQYRLRMEERRPTCDGFYQGAAFSFDAKSTGFGPGGVTTNIASPLAVTDTLRRINPDICLFKNDHNGQEKPGELVSCQQKSSGRISCSCRIFTAGSNITGVCTPDPLERMSLITNVSGEIIKKFNCELYKVDCDSPPITSQPPITQPPATLPPPQKRVYCPAGTDSLASEPNNAGVRQTCLFSWGQGTPGQSITVRGSNGGTGSGSCGSDGKWTVTSSNCPRPNDYPVCGDVNDQPVSCEITTMCHGGQTLETRRGYVVASAKMRGFPGDLIEVPTPTPNDSHITIIRWNHVSVLKASCGPTGQWSPVGNGSCEAIHRLTEEVSLKYGDCQSSPWWDR